MSKLIDWDEVLKWMHRQKETTEQWSMRIAIENYVDEMPTIDAVPVRHGKWIDNNIWGDDDPRAITRCSVCNTAFEIGMDTPYCPMCGAKMDGGEDGKAD